VTARGLVLSAYARIGRRLAGRRLDERSRLLRTANSALISYLRSDVARVQDHRMRVDSRDSLRLLVKGVYEPQETELVRREVGAGDVVLDLGANIGYFTLIFGALVGDKGRVFAFEPDPENFALLDENIAMNGYKTVVAVQAAVADQTGTTRLYLSEDNKGDHRIYDSRDDRRAIDVPVISLDDFFDGYTGRVDFIKMDIQGAEGLALAGMQSLLERTTPRMLLTEFAPASLRRAGTDPAHYLSLLGDAGYQLCEIARDGPGVTPTDASTLLRKYNGHGEGFANLLCVGPKWVRALHNAQQRGEEALKCR
jgi:FkbM family methyltransferase